MDNKKEQLLLQAVADGELGLCRELLAKGADPTAITEKYEYTALMLAARAGHLEIARLLLPICDVHARDVLDNTALIWAAYHGHVEIVRLLLPLSDVNAKDQDGITALEWALDNGHPETEKAIFAFIRSKEEAKELDAELTAKTTAVKRNKGI